MSHFTIVLIGASGFGRQIATYAADTAIEIAGYLDDDPECAPPGDYPLLGRLDDYDAADPIEALITVAEPRARQRLAERLQDRGIPLHTLVHPTAYVAPDARVAEGAIVCPYAQIGSGATIGANALINAGAMIGHDTVVGPHAALMTQVSINGSSTIGEGVFAGTHASVNPGRTVGSWSKIAAGSVVYHDMASRVLVSGNPASALPLVDLQSRTAPST